MLYCQPNQVVTKTLMVRLVACILSLVKFHTVLVTEVIRASTYLVCP